MALVTLRMSVERDGQEVDLAVTVNYSPWREARLRQRWEDSEPPESEEMDVLRVQADRNIGWLADTERDRLRELARERWREELSCAGDDDPWSEP